ncbi:WD40-repeat-containing domain protein [Spinellus fusiger]|nr:WD40-repeat-containing domain protein [Spinellus fusiger]
MSLGLSNNRVGHVATGNYHGHLQIWDIEHSEIPLSSYKAHGSIVNAISGVGENNASGYSPEIATGGKDGFVKVWDARECEKPVLSVNPSQNKAAQDIWCISFGDIKGHRVVAVGYANGDIRLFDVVASRYLWKTKVADGVCSLDFSNGEKEILMASTLDGLYSFDLSSGEMTPIAKIGLTLWAVRHCPQMPSISAIAGGDGRLRFSQENTPGFIHDKAITNHPVISFDWNRDAKGLFVCASFDQSLRVGMIKGI